ncbi:hypothetical protein ACROYT_G003772 [Oculina patagonica]
MNKEYYDLKKGLRLLCSEFDSNEHKMNLTSLATSGSFNVQSIINSSLDLQNKENNTSVVGAIEVTALIHFAYVIIVLASLFGNSVIIHIIRTDNSMKTTTNYLIVNQACADLVVSLTAILEVYLLRPTTNDRVWFKGVLGDITCKSFVASMYILPVFSVWILATIAVDRFYAVTRPLRASPISQHLKKTILFLWVWSIFTSTDVIVSAKVEKAEESIITIVIQITNGQHLPLVQ